MSSRHALKWFFPLFILLFACCENEGDFPVLRGPYLGQTPPGMTPEVFAPGIVTTKDRYELNSVFSPKRDEFYYEISTTTPEEKKEGKFFYVIMASKLVSGVWTKPEMVPFSGEHSTMDMSFSPDGNRLYFSSDRPDPWSSTPRTHIWYVERLEGGWSEPRIVGPPIYSPKWEQGQPTFAKDGTMYFRQNPKGHFDLYYSKHASGRYSEPVVLGEPVNTQYEEGKPFIEPNGGYLLFIRYEMPDSIDGGRGLYISFRQKDGSWAQAQNTNINGSLPRITPDGKYFFFSRGGSIYWVDAEVIERLESREPR